MEYIKNNNFKMDTFSEFSNFMENTDAIVVNAINVLKEFDDIGRSAIYLSDKDIFHKIFFAIINKTEIKELTSPDEIKNAIVYYLNIYWNFFLRSKIENQFFSEYCEIRRILQSSNATQDKYPKYYEQLFQKWNARLSHGMLKMQNLKENEAKKVKDKIGG